MLRRWCTLLGVSKVHDTAFPKPTKATSWTQIRSPWARPDPIVDRRPGQTTLPAGMRGVESEMGTLSRDRSRQMSTMDRRVLLIAIAWGMSSGRQRIVVFSLLLILPYTPTLSLEPRYRYAFQSFPYLAGLLASLLHQMWSTMAKRSG